VKARGVFAAMFGHRKALSASALVFATVLAFGVAFAAAVAPVVTVKNAANVEYTTADVEGTVNPEGQGTSWRFQFATQADFSDAQEGPSGFTDTSETVSGQLTGLQPGTTYHLRLLAENGDGPGEAVAASTFETKPVAKPVPSEPQVSSVTGKTAHFDGTVNPNAPEDNSALAQTAKDAYATHWWFTCQPGCSFSGASEGDIQADDDPVSVEADATGLGGSTEYTVTLHARNAAGEETNEKQFTTTVIKPQVSGSFFNAFNPGDTFATVAGTVNPENSQTDCRFVYGIGSPSGNEAPCSPPGALINERQTIRVKATSGQFRLSFESQTTPDLPFDASPVVIQEALEALSSIGAGNVSVDDTLSNVPSYAGRGYDVTFGGSLAGKDVPPLGAENGAIPLEYEAEGNVGPGEVEAFTPRDGSSIQPTLVTARLTGLAPGTKYRYKIVATNAAGTTEGPVGEFTTLSSPAAGGCPNASVRSEQHAASGECRGFEQVSPADKNGNVITGEGDNVVAAAAGDAAVFQSRGGFAGTNGSGATGFTQYLSRRGATGWSTKAITPTPSTAYQQLFFGGNEFFFFSEDLRKGILKGYDLPAREDDVANFFNLYRQDTDSGAFETVTLGTQKVGGVWEDIQSKTTSVTYGASADTGVVSFSSGAQLLPAATPGVKNTYEWDHGTLRLAGILPNGDMPSGGSTPPEYPTSFEGDGYRATVSSDGSRLIFAAPAQGSQQLYLRRNHSNTVWVTKSESTVPVAEPENVRLEWVSADAEKILFTTTSKLVDEDDDEGRDLYLYTDSPTPGTDDSNLELISEGDLSSGSAVVGLSDDASRIYWYTEDRVVLWEGGHERVALPYFPRAGDADDSLGALWQYPGRWRVSADGRYLAFRSDRNETGQVVSERSPNQMYVYDAVNNTLACASCLADGATRSGVPVGPYLNPGQFNKNVRQLRPRFLSEDGRRVFFSTASPLVSADTNGVMDVYVYDTHSGHIHLVSNGTGEEGAWFVNAGSSGDDAFFITRQSLIAADRDSVADLYDSRVNGGFAEPPPPPTPCSGDNCRGPLSSGSESRSPATATFSGPGNRQAKGKRHRKKHHKRHHRKHKRHGAKSHGAQKHGADRGGRR
jgi:WD40-like Beta Propeller Repeat